MVTRQKARQTPIYEGGDDHSVLLQVAATVNGDLSQKPKSVLRDLGVVKAADLRRLCAKYETQSKQLIHELKTAPQDALPASERKRPAAAGVATNGTAGRKSLANGVKAQKSKHPSQSEPKSKAKVKAMSKANGQGAHWPQAMSANAGVVAQVAQQAEVNGHRSMALQASSPVKTGLPSSAQAIDAWGAVMGFPAAWLGAMRGLPQMPALQLGNDMTAAMVEQQFRFCQSLLKLSPVSAMLKGQAQMANSMLAVLQPSKNNGK